MREQDLFEKIKRHLNHTSIELPTVPTGNRKPKWFKAYRENDTIMVDCAAKHNPSCDISLPRTISKKDFDLVSSYYDRWADGETGIRHEVSRKSRNTAESILSSTGNKGNRERQSSGGYGETSSNMPGQHLSLAGTV